MLILFHKKIVNCLVGQDNLLSLNIYTYMLKLTTVIVAISHYWTVTRSLISLLVIFYQNVATITVSVEITNTRGVVPESQFQDIVPTKT